jgi:hypothetical protein
MLLELPNHGGSNEKACSLSGNHIKCVQYFRWKIQVEETTWKTKVNIKMGVNERGYESLNWIQLAQSSRTVL